MLREKGTPEYPENDFDFEAHARRLEAKFDKFWVNHKTCGIRIA